MGKYSIGVDFGLYAVDAALVDIATGEKLSESSVEYTHGVVDAGSASLQHPMDYLEALTKLVPEVIAEAAVTKDQVVGLGIDFTNSSAVPVMKDGTPLCFFNEYAVENAALVRLATEASDKAKKLSEIASNRDEAFLSRFGGKLVSEGLVPLVWEILEANPKVYETADYFMDAADWVIWQLTGVQTRNNYSASLGAMWSKKEGYPDSDFFKSLDARLENLATQKLDCPVSPIGAKAGLVSPFVADALGLSENTSIAVANVSENALLPALAVGNAGDLLINFGKTDNFLLVGDSELYVPGICGTISGGAEDFYIYKAQKTGIETKLTWAATTFAGDYIAEKALGLKAGESGLLALDALNCNKLSAAYIGMKLDTLPSEMYRATIEAAAYGIRSLIEKFQTSGVIIKTIYATGQFTEDNPKTMQLIANVLDAPIIIKNASNAATLGSAILGALAAGCFDTLGEASTTMGLALENVFIPDEEEASVYNKLYQENIRLKDYFASGANNCMKRLSAIKSQAVAKEPAMDAATEVAIAELFEAVNEAAESVQDNEAATHAAAVEELFDAVNEAAESAVNDDSAMEELFDAIEEMTEDATEALETENAEANDVAELLETEANETVEAKTLDIEVPADAFEDLLSVIDESSEEVSLEATEEVNVPADAFDDLLSVIDEDSEEVSIEECGDAAEQFAEILDEQLDLDNIDYDALEDLAKLDGVTEEGDVVAEAKAEPTFDPFVDISLSYEVKDLMEKYGADPDALNSTFIAEDVKELMDKYGDITNSIRGYEINSEVSELMDKYTIVDSSVPGTFQYSDIEDEVAELIDNTFGENPANGEAEEITEASKEVTEAIENIEAEATEKVTETVEDIAEVTEEVAETVEDIKPEASEEVAEAVEEITEATSDEEASKDITAQEERISSFFACVSEPEATKAAEEITEATEELTEAVEDIAAEEITEATEEATETVEDIEAEATEEVTETVEDIEAETTEEVTETVEDIAAEEISETTEEATETVEDIAAEETTEATADEEASVLPEEDEELIPVPTLASEFPEFSHSKVRTNSSIPDDFWRY